MNWENRQKIIENLDFFAKNISNLPVLLNKLRASKILEEEEVQKINSKEILYEKCTEICTIVQKKGDSAFETFLHCLETSGSQAVVDKVRSFIPGNENEKIEKHVWFDVKPGTKFYKGREKEMVAIEKYWQETLTEKSLTFVAITGLGGIGKSELAKKFANTFFQDVKGHCIWINAESRQTIFSSFQRLAKITKNNLNDDSGQEKDLETLSVDVYRFLCKEKCLFIFDNVENYQETVFRCLIEYTNDLEPTKLRPLVLMTSRNKSFSQVFGHLTAHVPLDVLSMAASVDFFLSTLRIQNKNDTTVTLNTKLMCEKLKFFPLAMQQAAAYIKAKNWNDPSAGIQSYLEDFDLQTKKLLDFPLPEWQNMDGISRTTLLTWQITLNKIGNDSEARNALNLISLLHPDNMEKSFVIKLMETLFSNSSNNIDVFEILDEYSMCQRSKINGKIFIYVHRLVQEVMQILMEDEGKLTDMLDNLLETVYQMLRENKFDINDMMHVEILWKHAKGKNELIKKHLDLPEMIITKYDSSGKYRTGYDFISGEVEHLESVSWHEDRYKLRMMYWKGVFHDKLGEYQKALEILLKVHGNQKMIFAVEDDHTLATAAKIGFVHWRLKNLEAAMKWTSEALEKREKLYWKENKDTLKLKTNFALILDGLGRYDDSLKIYYELLEVRERLLGKDHPETVTVKLNIGIAKKGQGKFDEALEYLEQVVEVRERLFGAEHPKTLSIKNWIALTYKSAGNYYKAVKIFQEVLEVRKRVLGEEHPYTLDTQSQLDELSLNKRSCIVS